MKKLLLVSLFLLTTQLSYSQGMWGSSPQTVMRTVTKLGATLNSQDTNDKGELFLFFDVKEGLVSAFIFENQLLTGCLISVNTKFLIPSTPTGEERNINGKTVWIDYTKKERTTRTYEGEWVTDTVQPIN